MNQTTLELGRRRQPRRLNEMRPTQPGKRISWAVIPLALWLASVNGLAQSIPYAVEQLSGEMKWAIPDYAGAKDEYDFAIPLYTYAITRFGEAGNLYFDAEWYLRAAIAEYNQVLYMP